MTQRKHHLYQHVVLIFVTLLWASNVLVMKRAFEEIDAWMFSGIRLAATLPVVLIMGRYMPGYVPFERRDLLAISGIAMVGFASFQFMFPVGLYNVSAPVGGVLMATMPVWVVGINMIAGTDKVSSKSIGGVLLTVAGIVVITLAAGSGTTDDGSATSLFGVIILTLAELLFAINTVFLRPYMKKYSVSQVTSVAIVISVVIFIGILNRRIITFDYQALSSVTWAIICYSGIVPLYLSNILWNRSIKSIGSTQVAVYANLPPVFVLIMGALFLGEILAGWQVIGALGIAAGIILVQIKRKESKATQ